VFADTREGPSGIGFGERTRESLDPSKWTGENAVGLALETLRYQMREGSEQDGTAVSATGEADESVVTEEQQAAQRTGAIIASAAKKKFFRKGSAVPNAS
jgi:hypothetical protein